MLDVSVIIPTYNSGKLVIRAIESILSQTLQPDEIIVVDDGSVDNTEMLLQEYIGVIKYLKQKNQGVSAARNYGIREASSTWVAFLDADDEWLPDKLKCQTDILLEHPELNWCSGLSQISINGICNIDPHTLKYLASINNNAILAFTDACKNGVFIHTNTIMIKKTLFSELGYFNESLKISEDRDLWWRISVRYPQIGFCSHAYSIHYHDSPESLLNSTKDRSQSFEVILESIKYAIELDTLESREFISYANDLAYNYLIRLNLKEIYISPSSILLSDNLLDIGLIKGLLLKIFRILPRKLSRLIANYLYRFSFLNNPS